MSKRIMFLLTVILSIAAAAGTTTAKDIENDETKTKKKQQAKALTENAPPNQNETIVSGLDKTFRSSQKAAAGESINWQVVSSGGREVSSTNFKSTGTIGQVGIGYLKASNNSMNAGFWQNFETNIPGCCIGIRGNVDGDPGDEFDIADIVYFVDWLFNDLSAPPCLEEANVKLGPGEEEVDIADIIYLVDFLFNDGSPLPACSS